MRAGGLVGHGNRGPRRANSEPARWLFRSISDSHSHAWPCGTGGARPASLSGKRYIARSMGQGWQWLAQPRKMNHECLHRPKPAATQEDASPTRPQKRRQGDHGRGGRAGAGASGAASEQLDIGAISSTRSEAELNRPFITCCSMDMGKVCKGIMRESRHGGDTLAHRWSTGVAAALSPAGAPLRAAWHASCDGSAQHAAAVLAL